MLTKIRKKISSVSLFNLFVGGIGTIVGLDYIYRVFLDNDAKNQEPLIWAFSVTSGVFLLIGVMNYCAYGQGIMQDEIDRISRAKSELEKKVLKTRRTSKPRRKS